MNKFMDVLEKFIGPAANALQNNTIIQSISKGMMSMMPILMIGSFASLFQSLPIDAYTAFIQSTGIYAILGTIVNVTTNMLALYGVFCIAYGFTKNYSDNHDPLSAGAIALFSFLLLTPLTSTGEGWNAVTNLPLSWLGAKGLFTSMFVGILTGYIYNKLLDKNITIKLPDSVPPFVSKSFTGIIPGIIIAVFFAAVSMLIALTPFKDVHTLIYTVIGSPLNKIGGSVGAALIVMTLSGLCWFFGIHGIAVVSAVMPIWAAADAANVAAISKGAAATNIVTYNWVNAVGNIGGAGCTLGLMIVMVLFAKSERYKTFSKIGLVPSLFNINEPVTFGLPCMLNPILFFPFVFTPVLTIALAYGLTVIGILPVGNGVAGPMGTPILFAGMFTLGIRGVLWQVFATLLSMGIYFPFFKILDKQALEEEAALENK